MVVRQTYTAFTLVEFIIYLALVSLQSLLLFQFLTSMQIGIKKNVQQTDDSLRRWLLFDSLRRDILAASPQVNEWVPGSNVWVQKLISDKHEIERRCVGWQVTDGTVRRLQGDYDFVRNAWVKKTISVMYTKCARLTCKPIIDQKTNRVTKVEVEFEELSPEGKQTTFTVALRNGYV